MAAEGEAGVGLGTSLSEAWGQAVAREWKQQAWGRPRLGERLWRWEGRWAGWGRECGATVRAVAGREGAAGLQAGVWGRAVGLGGYKPGPSLTSRAVVGQRDATGPLDRGRAGSPQVPGTWAWVIAVLLSLSVGQTAQCPLTRLSPLTIRAFPLPRTSVCESMELTES